MWCQLYSGPDCGPLAELCAWRICPDMLCSRSLRGPLDKCLHLSHAWTNDVESRPTGVTFFDEFDLNARIGEMLSACSSGTGMPGRHSRSLKIPSEVVAASGLYSPSCLQDDPNCVEDRPIRDQIRLIQYLHSRHRLELDHRDHP